MSRSRYSMPMFWPEYLIKMTVDIDVGYGNAVFICGEEIGKWKQARRLECTSGNRWTINIDRMHLRNNAGFKFLVGPYDAGHYADVEQLSWQKGDNHYWVRKNGYPGEHFTFELNDFNIADQNQMRTGLKR